MFEYGFGRRDGIAHQNVLHQSLRVGPSFGGHLRKLRFLLRCEMDFHRLQSTGNLRFQLNPHPIAFLPVGGDIQLSRPGIDDRRQADFYQI